ncbi:MAG TPA: rod shape-determining protein [Candidatus Competibacteraceae bacterium]|nr:rod shape-determining protein [Candidatus Competibacteraceae bacterium]
MTDKTSTPANGALCVGIDLGTSRSVVSASNGKRRWVESYVGWPKDFVARKMLGKKVLFGAEALNHRLSLNLVRPLANGVIQDGTEKNEESVRELIGHLIELVEPAPGQAVHAAVGIPAEALKVNRDAIKKAVSQFADKLIVVSEPFSVAYGLNALDNAMVIDIGAGTVDFCIMHGTMPGEDDQRSLISAGDYVDNQLLALLNEKHPAADFTVHAVRKFKEKYAHAGEMRKKAEVQVPSQGRMVTLEIGREIKRACESIVPAIAETAMDLIARFDPDYQEKVRQNIILAGGGSQIEGLEEALGEAMKDFAPCRFIRVDNPLYAGADGALALAQDMPAEYWENIGRE